MQYLDAIRVLVKRKQKQNIYGGLYFAQESDGQLN